MRMLLSPDLGSMDSDYIIDCVVGNVYASDHFSHDAMGSTSTAAGRLCLGLRAGS